MSTWLLALVLLPIALVLVAGLVVLLARPRAAARPRQGRPAPRPARRHAARVPPAPQPPAAGRPAPPARAGAAPQRARHARRGAGADRRPPAPLRAEGRLPVTAPGRSPIFF